MSTHAPAHRSHAGDAPGAAAAHQAAHRAAHQATRRAAHQAAHRALPKLNDSFENQKLHLRTASTQAAHSGSGGSILRTVIALVIVIAVIYGLTLIVKRLKRTGAGASASGDGMERISQLPLGSNRSVALIRVGTELHLLGVAEHSVTPIRHFSEDEAIELGLPVSPPGSVFTMRGGRGGDDADRVGGPLSALRGGGSLAGTLDGLRRMTQR